MGPKTVAKTAHMKHANPGLAEEQEKAVINIGKERQQAASFLSPAGIGKKDQAMCNSDRPAVY